MLMGKGAKKAIVPRKGAKSEFADVDWKGDRVDGNASGLPEADEGIKTGARVWVSSHLTTLVSLAIHMLLTDLSVCFCRNGRRRGRGKAPQPAFCAVRRCAGNVCHHTVPPFTRPARFVVGLHCTCPALQSVFTFEPSRDWVAKRVPLRESEQIQTTRRHRNRYTSCTTREYIVCKLRAHINHEPSRADACASRVSIAVRERSLGRIGGMRPSCGTCRSTPSAATENSRAPTDTNKTALAAVSLLTTRTPLITPEHTQSKVSLVGVCLWGCIH